MNHATRSHIFDMNFITQFSKSIMNLIQNENMREPQFLRLIVTVISMGQRISS